MAIQFDNTNTGTTTLKPPASGSWTLVLPASNGSTGNVLTTDGSGNLTWGTAGGAGTVTSVSVVSANGFTGTSSGGSTPALTLTTSITGVLKGNGTAIQAATSGTDYQAPIGTISGVVKGNGANALTAAVAGTDYQAPIGTISGVVKGNGANALTAAVAGTDFVAPSNTFFIGTTSIAHNRASAALSLAGVNIDGSANTLATNDDRTKAPSDDPAGAVRFGFTSFANNSSAPYADYLHLRSYTDATGGNENLVMFRKDAIGMRVWQQAWGSGTAYATFKDVAFTDGTVAVGTTVTTTASTTNSAFKIPMLNTTGVATGNFGLLLDSAGASDFTYNPSTNTLVVGVAEVTSPTPATINAIRARSNIAWQSPSATSTITSKMLDSGTLSFEGTVGQLFSITNSMTGTIFSVNDISGIPSIEVLDTGVVKIAQYAGFVAYGVSPALTSVGNSQGTALLLTRPINDVTTVAASTGIRLPVATPGMRIVIRNGGANTLNVYPASGAQINGLGSNVAFGHTITTVLEFVAFTATQWYTLNTTYA
jgi:hypothetical protein